MPLGYQHIRMYDLNSNNPNPVISYDGVSKNIASVGFHEDGRWMYTGGEDCTARIWDLRCGAGGRTPGRGCVRVGMLCLGGLPREVEKSELADRITALVCKGQAQRGRELPSRGSFPIWPQLDPGNLRPRAGSPTWPPVARQFPGGRAEQPGPGWHHRQPATTSRRPRRPGQGLGLGELGQYPPGSVCTPQPCPQVPEPAVPAHLPG